MAFIDDIKKIYLQYGVEFPNVEITPFMEDFIERTYNALKAPSQKYAEPYNMAELFMDSYEKSLVNKARISFSDKISSAKLVSGNCECVEFTLNDGTKKIIPLPLSKVATGFKKNSSMRSPAGADGPKGLQDIIDGFQIFWEKSEWSDDVVDGTSKPEVHTVECGQCDNLEYTPKLIVNGNTDESKEELKKAFTRFFTPRHSYKAEREIILFAILRELSQSLEKHFNGYSGEYYGFDIRDKKKVLKLEWDSIKYSNKIDENIPPTDETVDPEDYVEFGNVKMVVNIKRPVFGFELTGYNSWGNGQPTHGFFKQRLGYKGPHKTGRQINYAGGPPPEGYKGWGDPNINFKNWINMSYFESQTGTGRGTESEYRWGAVQLNGATVYDGKHYGAKTHSRTWAPTYYYLKGDDDMKRTTSGKIFKAKPGRTIEYDFKADFLENIQVAITCAGSIVENGKSKSPGSGYGKANPFFGKLDDGTYFAGVGIDMYTLGDRLIDFFKKRGKKVEWADCGDGGGSQQLFVNGVSKWVKNEKDNRPVGAVIGW